MTKVMMMLGPYPFMLDTAPYQSMTRRSDYRWEQQDRIGRAPAQQFMGPGAGEITVTGEILPHFKGGLGQLPAMRKLAARGRPLLLVSGRGDVLGDWTITSIEETTEDHWADGAAGVITFTVTLREYGGDGIGVSAFIAAISAVMTVARLL